MTRKDYSNPMRNEEPYSFKKKYDTISVRDPEIFSSDFPVKEEINDFIMKLKGDRLMSLEDENSRLSKSMEKLDRLEREAYQIAVQYPDLRMRVYEEYETDLTPADKDLDNHVAWIISSGFTDYDKYLKFCKTNRQNQVFDKLKTIGIPKPKEN
jgi:hypothetical protein